MKNIESAIRYFYQRGRDLDGKQFNRLKVGCAGRLGTRTLELWRGPAAGWPCRCGSLAWRWRAQFDHAAGLQKQTTGFNTG